MNDFERKRKREDEKLKAGEKKSSKAKNDPSKRISSKSNQFNSEEVKAILLSLFNGLNDKEASDEFFKFFNKSTRTKAAVKAKIAKLREELTNRINGITDQDQEKNGVFFLPFFSFSLSSLSSHLLSPLFLLISFLIRSGSSSLKFLAPALIQTTDGEVLFVHHKKQWSQIEVRWNTTHVRFALKKIALPLKEGDAAEYVPKAFVQFEIPADHAVKGLCDDEEWKGVKLKVIPVKGKEKDEFSMC